jgi:hypothetical protein
MILRQSAALLTAVKVEKKSKHVPGYDKVSQNTSSRCNSLYLLVLLRGDFWLMSDVGPWLLDLWIMSSKNAANRCHILI